MVFLKLLLINVPKVSYKILLKAAILKYLFPFIIAVFFSYHKRFLY